MKKQLLFALAFLFTLSLNGQWKNSQDTLRFQWKQTVVPAGLLLSGGIAHLSKENVKVTAESKAKGDALGLGNYAEDYLQFTPHLAAFGLEIFGVKPKTDYKNRFVMMVKGEILALASSYILKKAVKNNRPDGSAYAFPSGHTANVFAGATLLSEEYKDEIPWIPYAAYGVASGVGVLRMSHEKHYFSDVLFGAGLGILSMKMAYWTHQYRWNRKKNSETDPLAVIYKFNAP